jgi:hypothetical protein
MMGNIAVALHMQNRPSHRHGVLSADRKSDSREVHGKATFIRLELHSIGLLPFAALLAKIFRFPSVSVHKALVQTNHSHLLPVTCKLKKTNMYGGSLGNLHIPHLVVSEML